MTSFSIVIPTRNRAALATAAIASAIAQRDATFEVVVSDNSSDAAQADAVRQAVDQSADSRIRYIRPPEPLPMPQHWEWSTRHAVHDYVLVLTDRLVLRPGALALLARIVEADPLAPPDVLRWTVDAGFDADGRLHEPEYGASVQSRDCEEILTDFANGAQWRSTLLGSNSLPRGLNSAVRRELLDAIRAEHGQAFAPISPDYVSAFHILARAKSLVEIDISLVVAHGNQSNGASSMRDGVANYVAPFGLDPFEGCPLNIDTVINTTFRDYLWVDRALGGTLPPLDPVGYLLINWRELQLKRELGSRLDIAGMRAAILSAAGNLPEAERRAFAAGRALIDARETIGYRLRNLLARWHVLGPLKTATAIVMGGRRAATGPKYPNVLDAIAAVPFRAPDRLG